MDYQIEITSPAEQDLLEILLYISDILKNPEAAERLYLSLKTEIQSLSSLPLRHPIVGEPFPSQKDIRMFPVKNDMVFYVVHQEKRIVSVLRVLYKRREWQQLFK